MSAVNAKGLHCWYVVATGREAIAIGNPSKGARLGAKIVATLDEPVIPKGNCSAIEETRLRVTTWRP
jgi:hypothetical protein